VEKKQVTCPYCEKMLINELHDPIFDDVAFIKCNIIKCESCGKVTDKIQEWTWTLDDERHRECFACYKNRSY